MERKFLLIANSSNPEAKSHCPYLVVSYVNGFLHEYGFHIGITNSTIDANVRHIGIGTSFKAYNTDIYSLSTLLRNPNNMYACHEFTGDFASSFPELTI